MIKKISLILILGLSTTAFAGIGDTVTTTRKVVSLISIEMVNNKAYYYLKTNGGWEAANCDGTINSAYLPSDQVGAEAVLSLALTSKTTGQDLQIKGICGDTNGNPGYLQIKRINF